MKNLSPALICIYVAFAFLSSHAADVQVVEAEAPIQFHGSSKVTSGKDQWRKYASGQGTATLQVRGDGFTFHAAEPFGALFIRYRLERGGVTLRFKSTSGIDVLVPLHSAVAKDTLPRRAFEFIRLPLPKGLSGMGDWTVMLTEHNGGPVYVDALVLASGKVNLKQPDWLCITDYGAIPDDDIDDSEAFYAAISEAKSRGMVVWMPPGRFDRIVTDDTPPSRASLLLDGVRLVGAGPELTELRLTVRGVVVKGAETAVRLPLVLGGKGSGISGFLMSCAQGGRAKGKRNFSGHDLAVSGRAEDYSIKDIWFLNTGTGPWVGGRSGQIDNCLILGSHADGIHIAGGASDIEISNNFVFGSGDDGIAVIGELGHGSPARRVAINGNEVRAMYWGNGISIAGAENVLVESNEIIGVQSGAGIAVNQTPSYPTFASDDVRIVQNRIERCGIEEYTPRSAIWIYVAHGGISGLKLDRNALLRCSAPEVIVRTEQLNVATLQIGIIFRSPNADAPLIGVQSRSRGVAYFEREEEFSLTQNKSPKFKVQLGIPAYDPR